MASIIFNSFFEDQARGNIDADTDLFKVMLVTSAYVEDKDAHTKRSDITGEITGTGYVAGGAAIACTVTPDDANDRLDLVFAQTVWSSSTLTAAGAVIYKDRGGAATADELVAYVDFGGDVASTGADFTLNASTIRVQN